MKVLLSGRASLYDDVGGDTVQITKYREYAEKNGVRMICATGTQPDVSPADLVHCFNIQVIDQTYAQIRWAKEKGKKVVFSPVYWNLDEYQRFRMEHARELGNSRLKEHLKKRWNSHVDCLKQMARHSPRMPHVRSLTRLLRKGKCRLQQECLLLADLILVSAPSERRILVRDFPLTDPGKVKVLANGVDRMFYRPEPESFVRRFGIKDFLLCVGRVEPHKNQVSVIRAVRSLPYSLVIVGSQRDPHYSALCRESANSRTRFFGYLPHPLLPSVYAAARAHILASWFDIPGLVNLEAGLAGCNVVSTNRGSTQDYLEKNAWYLEPGNVSSIKMAIRAAMESPRKPDLVQNLLGKYCWEQVAQQLVRYYQETLEQP
jgi:glycosyltransferase involved in cell wall biosynthesis